MAYKFLDSVGLAHVFDKIKNLLAGKSDINHTHNYAGSASVGGAADSANKLNANAGNTGTPVYFENGVPKACTTLQLEVAGNSESATKDADGNVITDTYETKANAITGLSVSGQTITYTKGDGKTGTITTQDTIATLNSLGVTATSAELNLLDGVTATTAELNYVDGVTSNIQTQLNGKLSTSGTAAKATADASGNNIVNTYATKTELATALTTDEIDEILA